MLNTSSPRDLYSTISSFKPFSQVFLTHKSLILSIVVQLAIPAEGLPDALAACNASKFDISPSSSIRRTEQGRVQRAMNEMTLMRHDGDLPNSIDSTHVIPHYS